MSKHHFFFKMEETDYHWYSPTPVQQIGDRHIHLTVYSKKYKSRVTVALSESQIRKALMDQTKDRIITDLIE